MELYVLAAGQIDHLNRWQQDLNSVRLPVYKNGKEVPRTLRRLLVAPVQLFKIGFPKEQMEEVIAAVCPDDYPMRKTKSLGIFASWIRKKLGLREVPKTDKINPYLSPNAFDKAVAIMPLGIKDDIMNDEGEEQI